MDVAAAVRGEWLVCWVLDAAIDIVPVLDDAAVLSVRRSGYRYGMSNIPTLDEDECVCLVVCWQKQPKHYYEYLSI